MKVLIYSDAQATDGHECCFTDPTKPLQLWRIERMYDEIQRIYTEHKCQALWDLGDTTDDRTAIPVSVIDLLCDRLEAFDGKWNIKLVGNHEQFLRDTKVHAGKMFRRFFHVVDTCEALKIGNVNLLCVSYHDDVEKILKFLRHQPKTEKTILLGHFQVTGCQMSSGTAVTGVPRDQIEFVNTAILGHIHKPQSMGMGHIHYVGSPFQQHWGESGENKRVGILDITDSSIRLEWVPMEGFPKYRQVLFGEFVQLVKEASEDRYKVVLSSIEEMEKFYAHPMSNRVDEAIYAFEQEASSEEGGAIPRSKSDILSQYMQKNPPADLGIVLDDPTVLDFGEQITTYQ